VPTWYNIIFSAKVVNPQRNHLRISNFFSTLSHPSAGGQASSLLFHKQTLFLSQRNEGLCHSRSQNKNSVLKIKPRADQQQLVHSAEFRFASSARSLALGRFNIFTPDGSAKLNTHCRPEQTQ